MHAVFVRSLVWTCLLGSTLVIGCSDANQNRVDKSEAWKEGLDQQTIEAFSSLTDQDRTIAMAQKTCAVTGEPLGSMGTPIKVMANHKAYFLCCEGCRDAFEADPAKYTGGETSKTADWKQGLDDEAIKAFSELSEADRAAALAQKNCMVAKEPLGSMGTPIKVTVEGKDYFLCCKGCVKPFESNPDKYINAETPEKN